MPLIFSCAPEVPDSGSDDPGGGEDDPGQDEVKVYEVTFLNYDNSLLFIDEVEDSPLPSNYASLDANSQYNASGEVAKTLNSTLSQHLIKLNKIRAAVPALRLGQYTRNGCSGSMSFIRRYQDVGIDSLALVTISSGSTFSNIPNGTYVDLVSGDEIRVSSGRLTTESIAKGNVRVYVLENSSSGNLTQIGKTTTYLY